MLHSGFSVPSDSFIFIRENILLVRYTYCVSIVTLNITSIHRWLRGLRGSLILLATHDFIPHSSARFSFTAWRLATSMWSYLCVVLFWYDNSKILSCFVLIQVHLLAGQTLWLSEEFWRHSMIVSHRFFIVGDPPVWREQPKFVLLCALYGPEKQPYSDIFNSDQTPSEKLKIFG